MHPLSRVPARPSWLAAPWPKTLPRHAARVFGLPAALPSRATRSLSPTDRIAPASAWKAAKRVLVNAGNFYAHLQAAPSLDLPKMVMIATNVWDAVLVKVFPAVTCALAQHNAKGGRRRRGRGRRGEPRVVLSGLVTLWTQRHRRRLWVLLADAQLTLVSNPNILQVSLPYSSKLYSGPQPRTLCLSISTIPDSSPF